MGNLKGLVFMLVNLFSVGIGYGQEQFYFEIIDKEKGLSNNTVNCITEDLMGNMWFGTYDGLNCYDGKQITIFKHNLTNPGSIANNMINHLWVDKNGNVWIGEVNNHVSKYLGNKCFKNYDLNIFGRDEIVRFYEGKKGELIVETGKNRFQYNELGDQFVINNDLPDNTAGGKVLGFVKSYIPSGVNIDKAICLNEEYWVSTRGQGLFCIKKNEKGNYQTQHITQRIGIQNTLSNNEVYDIFGDRFGILWVATKDGGVNRLMPQAGCLKTLCYESGKTNTLPNATVRAICEDASGNIWIGTYNGGVAFYSKQDHTYHLLKGVDKKLSDWDRVRSIFVSSDKSVWIGSYMGLCRIMPNGSHCYYYPGKGANELLSGRIYSMAEDSQGFLWICTWNGLDRFNLKTNQFEHVNVKGLEDKHLRTICIDKSGLVWLGAEFGGVTIYNPISGLCRFLRSVPNKQNSLISNSIFSIIQDRTGKFWIGTSDGLNLFDPKTNLYTCFTTNNGLLSNLILGVLEDNKGRIWASTSRGISCIDPKTFFVRCFNEEDGFVNQEYTEGAYCKGVNGDLYFGGTNGINFFQPLEMYVNSVAPEVFIGLQSLSGDRISKSNSPEKMTLSYFNRTVNLLITARHTQSPSKNCIAWMVYPSDTTWQYSYSSNAIVPLNHLKPGVYKICYKAANCDGVWSNVYSLRLKINPPFWLNKWFIVCSILLIFGLTFCIIQYKLYGARKKNQLLEVLVAERTNQIKEQSVLLEKQNFELVASNNDILKQRDQILAQRDHLVELHSKLKEENSNRTSFFTYLSHEIRTPLTMIYGPVDNLLKELDEVSNKETVEVLQMIKQQTDYLLTLVNQTLDYRKIESGNMELNIQAGDIIQFCNEITGQFLPKAHHLGISLRFVSDISTLIVFLDFEKIKQIVNNLLSNALKFTHENGLIILEVGVDSSQNMLQIKVTDNGIGISSDRVEFIFDRFYQIGKSESNGISGSGLGLSLVKELVTIHGGTIDVFSKPEEGSVFVVSLPISNVQDNEVFEDKLVNTSEISSEDNENEESEKKGQKKAILLVEDNQVLLKYISGVLRKKDFIVYTALNGKEGLKIIKNRSIDLILSDWLMPIMNGLELCKKVKSTKKFRHIPFLFLTASLNSDDQISAFHSGADDYIIKPFSEVFLVSKIISFINREEDLKESILAQQYVVAENKKEITGDERLMGEIIRIINDNISKPMLKPDDLAEILSIGKMKLYRKCKTLTGHAPIELINIIRLKRAAQLLSQNGYTISEVCYKVGFNDPKYFSRCFQKAFNVTPSQYQADNNASKVSDRILISD